MGDFLKCPRAYYLRNVYKDPKTGHKVNIISPALALGQAVHEVLENLANFKAEDRLQVPMLKQYEEVFAKFAGEKGGFKSQEEEKEIRKRGEEMIKRVLANPGPIVNKAIKIAKDLPNFYLSEKENIILCGKVDWLEYLPETDSVHIIDFKTGKNEEKDDSLQLPIYLLLVKNTQKREVGQASYWYLDKEDAPLMSKKLPSYDESFKKVLKVALQVKEARAKKEFKCPQGEKGCFSCRPFEKILRGEAKFVGVGGYNQDMYIV